MYAAISASTLSELELSLGDVPAAEATAAQSVTFADRSGDWGDRIINRTTHADALHQAGRLEASRTRFAEAETMQAEDQPGYLLLYSLQGYQYCDLLLGAAERAAWRRCAGFAPAGSPGGELPAETAAETAALLSDLAAVERRAAQTRAEARSPPVSPRATLLYAVGSTALWVLHVILFSHENGEA